MAKPWVNVVQLNKVIDEECCDGALKVNIQLPESDVEDCEWNVTTVEALPTAPQGVQKVQICNPQSDAMLTCVQENANIYFIDYENDSDTYKVFDFQWNDVTWTVTPVKCEDIELTADKEPVCDNWANLWEHTIYKNWIADDVYYTAMWSTTPIIPSWPVTPWKCEIPATIKTITKTVDCSGTTADVDTTKTVEAVIDQTLDVKQCNKLESLSEYPVCAAWVTLIKKTTLDSEGTEIETFYWDNWTVVATPTAYEIWACVVEIPWVDISFTPWCSDIDGRAIVTRVSTNKITNVDTITLLEADHVTPVTDGSVMVNCSWADYEEVSVSCRENTAWDRFTVTTYIDPTDPTDVKKVWVDDNGDVIPEPTGTTPCESTCKVDMAYESCFDTGAGTVKVRWYFVKDSNYNEEFKTGFVISDDNLTYPQGTDVSAEVWLNTDKIVDCTNTVYEELATWRMLASWNTFTLPANVISFTVTVQDRWTFDVSFDGWNTYALTWRIWTRIWGQWTIEPISNTDQIIIRSNWDVDIIWEI